MISTNLHKTKHIGVINYYELFNQNNNIFDSSFYTLSDNSHCPMTRLKSRLAELGFELSTLDRYPLEEFSKILYLDYPTNNEHLLELPCDHYLVIFESELIKPDNWSKKNHAKFNKVFTWSTCLTDCNRYINLPFPVEFPENSPEPGWDDRPFTYAIIAGNKYSFRSNELYSERCKVIEWFERNYPEKLKVYGIGWQHGIWCESIRRLNSGNFSNRVLSKCLPLRITRPFKKKLTCYQGTVTSKKQTLKKHKFSICFENAKEIYGYITEKIFDSFFALCVPIYFGAPDILSFVPKDCFIDYRHFRDIEEMYTHTSTMSESDYKNYQLNILDFLHSDAAKKFSSHQFADKVTRNIV